MGRRISSYDEDTTISGEEQLLASDGTTTVNIEVDTLSTFIEGRLTTAMRRDFGNDAGEVIPEVEGGNTATFPETKIPLLTEAKIPDTITRDTELTTRVATPVPAGALFTDTNTQRSDADIDGRADARITADTDIARLATANTFTEETTFDDAIIIGQDPAFTNSTITISKEILFEGLGDTHKTGLFASNSATQTTLNLRAAPADITTDLAVTTLGTTGFNISGGATANAGSISAITPRLIMNTTGAGIQFGNSPLNATANYLNDYEEGTWVPTVDFGSGSGTLVSSSGTYVKVGAFVHLTGTVRVASSAGNVVTLVAGHPFAPVNNEATGTWVLPAGSATNVGRTGITIYRGAGSQQFWGASTAVINSGWQDNSPIEFTLTYRTNA